MKRLAIVLALCAAAHAAHADDRVTVKVGAAFQPVREAVEMAITNRGLVVNNVSHVGDMLARTGRDTGLGKPLYGTAEVLEFCSAVVSRRMMEADPGDIVHCPYSIAVYTLPGDPATTYIGYRTHAAAGAGPALRAVDQLLQDIVSEASQSVM